MEIHGVPPEFWSLLSSADPPESTHMVTEQNIHLDTQLRSIQTLLWIFPTNFVLSASSCWIEKPPTICLKVDTVILTMVKEGSVGLEYEWLQYAGYLFRDGWLGKSKVSLVIFI